MTTALARSGARWMRVRWLKESGAIAFDPPVSSPGQRGLWVGEERGTAVVFYNGWFKYGTALGKGNGGELRSVLTLFANPELRKRYVKG